jgi:hypothetical protein
MMAIYFWQLGSLIFVVLGSLHLFYTLFANKFASRSEAVNESMRNAHPILTRQTTMWKAWIGFNASHSSGAIFIGVINFYVAWKYKEVLHDYAFLLFTILTTIFYLWLAKKYWFKMPFRGILIALVCFLISFVLILVE